MAAAYVRDTGKIRSTAVSTSSGSFGVLPTVGNHVIVGASMWDQGPSGFTSCTDNQSNSYAKDAEGLDTAGDANAAVFSTKVATSSGTYTITLDPVVADGNYIVWVAAEFSGLDATTHKDRTGTNNSASGDANVTASLANSTASGLAFAVASVSNNDIDLNIGDTPPTGYTNLAVEESPADYMGLSCVYKIYSGSETSSATWSHDNVDQSGWAAAIVTYKAATGGGGTAYTKSVAGSITATGALRKKTARRLTGSTTASGSVRKKTARKLTGSVTATSTLAERIVFTKAIAGSITAAGVIRKKTLKALSGSITGAGAIRKKTFRRLTGSITAAGSVLKKTSRKLTGSITPAAALQEAYRVFKSFAGSITAAGALTTEYLAWTAGSAVSRVYTHIRRFIGRR